MGFAIGVDGHWGSEASSAILLLSLLEFCTSSVPSKYSAFPNKKQCNVHSWQRRISFGGCWFLTFWLVGNAHALGAMTSEARWSQPWVLRFSIGGKSPVNYYLSPPRIQIEISVGRFVCTDKQPTSSYFFVFHDIFRFYFILFFVKS